MRSILALPFAALLCAGSAMAGFYPMRVCPLDDRLAAELPAVVGEDHLLQTAAERQTLGMKTPAEAYALAA